MLGYLVFVWEQKRYETKIGWDIRKRKIFGILDVWTIFLEIPKSWKKKMNQRLQKGTKFVCVMKSWPKKVWIDYLYNIHIIYTHTSSILLQCQNYIYMFLPYPNAFSEPKLSRKALKLTCKYAKFPMSTSKFVLYLILVEKEAYRCNCIIKTFQWSGCFVEAFCLCYEFLWCGVLCM
mgnify:CR=1 FL=1